MRSLSRDTQQAGLKQFPVIICAVDSLSQRKEIWDYMRKNGDPSLYIDARMGGEVFRIITIDMNDKKAVKNYDERIHEPQTPHEEVCTAKAIAYNTFILSGMIASQVKKYAKKQAYKANINFDIPSTTLL